jgi:hypothetical protein
MRDRRQDGADSLRVQDALDLLANGALDVHVGRLDQRSALHEIDQERVLSLRAYFNFDC